MTTRKPTVLTRRQFLRHASIAAAAAWAGPLIVPGRVLGRDGGVAPSNRITFGFIGTGRQTLNANLPGFLHEPETQVVAVCDVDSWRMQQAQTRVAEHYARKNASGVAKGCDMVPDWREVIARQDVDAVMIATPDHWHVIMALAALNAGKDVSCEKPLTRSIAEGRLLADTVARTGRVFCTDSEFRSYGVYRRAAELVRNGKLGKLQRIITATPQDGTLAAPPTMPVPEELNYPMWLGPAPEAAYTEQRVHPRHDAKGRPGWLLIRDYADGMLANWGAHLNDIAMWANNTECTGPVEVAATGQFPPAGNLWNVVQEFEANFQFANGVRLTCRTDKPYIRFEGTEGWLQAGFPPRLELEPESLLDWSPGPEDVRLPIMKSEKRDFLDAVKARRQPQYSAEGGHRNASLSHLALASIELGRTLKWDPVKETVVDDPAANDYLRPKPLRAPWKL
jgi:myo-inositol 2-dehydrogenase / D-chiro-inositol 1-dehydrogenase